MLILYLPLVLAYTQPGPEPNANAAYNPSQKGSDWSGDYIPSQKGPDCELLKNELKKVFEAYDAVKPGCEEKTIEETPAMGSKTRCYTVGLCDDECQRNIKKAVENYGRVVDAQHQFLPTGGQGFDLSPVHQVLRKINYESFDFLENNPACGVMMGDSVYGEARSLCKAKYFHCGPIPCHEIVAPTLREHSISLEEFTRRCERGVSIACKVVGDGYKEARTTACFGTHCKCELNAERRLDSNYESATPAPPTPSYVAPTAAPTNQVYTPPKLDSGICEPNVRDLSVYTIYLKLSILYAADEGVFDRLPNCAADSLVPFLTSNSPVKHTYIPEKRRRRKKKKKTNYLPYILVGGALFLILVVILVVYIVKMSGSKDDPGAINLGHDGWRQASDPGELDTKKKKKEKRKSGERSQPSSPKSPKMPDTSPSSKNPKLPDTSPSFKNPKLPDTSPSFKNPKLPYTSPSSKNPKLPYASASSKSPRTPRPNKPELSPGRVLSPLEISTIVTSPSRDRKLPSPRFNDRRDRRKVKLPATSPTDKSAASNFFAE